MATSRIEWTNATWNPITGCRKVSAGCELCYAERLSKRLCAMGISKYARGFEVVLHEDVLQIPLLWKKPRLVFTNSMSDLFHEEVPFSFILEIFSVMAKASWHQYQILTKRSERLLELDSQITWFNNIWMGVSVEEAKYSYRIEHLKRTKSIIKFISFEPLLGPVSDINLSDIDWVIVGGESGPGARLMKEEWVIDIRDQCIRQNIPFFFKQWGGNNKRKAGRLLDGKEWNEFPKNLQNYDIDL